MKNDYSCVRSTFEVSRRIKCSCKAYPYPHTVGGGLCSTIIDSPPIFIAPKKGLASKLCKFVDALEIEIDLLTDEHCDRISQLLLEFKKDFYAVRDTENIQLCDRNNIN